MPEKERTKLQDRIVEAAAKNPDQTNEEIAEDLDCSAGYVGETRRRFEDEIESRSSSSSSSSSESSGTNPIAALILLPIQLTVWTLKVSVWLCVLPFKILAKLFGGGD